MSPGLAVLGISILGTWGLATAGILMAGITMLFFPGEAPEGDNPALIAGIVLTGIGLLSAGALGAVVTPLLGIDPPLPIKKVLPESKLKNWGSAGRLEALPEGTPKEVRIRSVRVTLVRQGDEVNALGALCSHARLPLAGLPGSPVKALPISDGCVTCPFHGARYDIETGRAVRQPFCSEWNQDHPFLGRLQNKLLFFNKKSPDQQTYPVRIEDGEVFVKVPK